MCAYNPAQPTLAYFTVGDAIAALGFTLAIQQLFKPIYLFRLRAYGLRILYLSLAVFLGAVCSIIAMILPNLPISHEGLLEHPVFWELAGGILIGGAYGIAALVSLKPVRLNTFNLYPFIRAAATLLSAASDDDRVAFAHELLASGNIERLARYALAWKAAELHGSQVEFERLRAAGAPLMIRGRPPVSAFYRFAHRRELAAASAATTLLQIMADPDFCSVLVRKCSWLTAATLDKLAQQDIHVDQAESFVREIANQAILNEDSMMAKEVGYTGFGTLPLLSQSLFANWFMLHHYDPLSRLNFKTPKVPSAGFVARLNSASKMMLETAIKGGSYWGERYIYSVEGVYENLSRQWSYTRPRSLPVEYAVTLHMGIAELYNMLRSALNDLKWEMKKPLFVTDPEVFRNDIIDAVARITYESLTGIANAFTGPDDDAWTHAIGVFLDVYPPHDSEPVGMDPLQQQLALKILEKLRHNMDGWYPAISRVLLAVIGPYDGHPQISKRTAHVILKDAVYKQLQKLPALQAKNPEKIADFLPSSVTYDSTSNTLTHIYRGGATQSTNLPALQIPEIDLCDEQNWQTPEAAGAPSPDAIVVT
jgi:hypothetical protein